MLARDMHEVGELADSYGYGDGSTSQADRDIVGVRARPSPSARRAGPAQDFRCARTWCWSARCILDAYGWQTITSGGGVSRSKSAVGFDRGFTGYVADNETGQYYARARQYSPTLGRFVGRDPIGYVDGMGLYGAYFVPSALDPLGLEWRQLADGRVIWVPVGDEPQTPPGPPPKTTYPYQGGCKTHPNGSCHGPIAPLGDFNWSYPGVELSNNCYSYACNSPLNPFGGKPQPGQWNPDPGIRQTNWDRLQRWLDSKEQPDCATIEALAESDGLKKVDCGKECPCGQYKIQLFVGWVGGVKPPAAPDPKNPPRHDYHWYRQDSNGTWSDKPGHFPVSAGHGDPMSIDRGGYSIPCACFCVPNAGLQPADDKLKKILGR